MIKAEYLEKRQALMNQANELLKDNNLEESEAIMAQVEALDNEWEVIKLENANKKALEENEGILNIEGESLKIEGGITMGEMNVKGTNVLNDNVPYETVWAKHLQGFKLEGEEKEVFNKFNPEFENAYTHTTVNTPTLIPETVVSGIWKLAEEKYPLLADVRKFNVKGTFVMNKLASIDAGDADWYDEATATADEQNTFGQLTLTGCELAKAITITWRMRSMSVEDFIPFIIRELGERIGAAMGKGIAQGKGKPGELDTFKPQPLGIETALLAESNTPQVVSFTALAPADYDDIVDLVSKVHSTMLDGAAFYANNATIWTVLAKIVGEDGRPIFIPDASAGGVGKMFGYVVKADAGLSAGSVVFGNGAGYVLNTSEPMSVAMEEHVKARTVDYAAYAIVDGGLLSNKAFALLKKSS